MLQRKFKHIKLRDLREHIKITMCGEPDSQGLESLAYAETMLDASESKSATKARVIFIFPKNFYIHSRPNSTICLTWNCKRYITFQVFKLTPHLLICQAFEDIASVSS
ncbi:MAG: hypothetical protein H6850_01850 [Alphaproteobacteria bacterium]|nr:MAG: hypothetical protein H6850_01850 [Alphaproteobacteria bacterium]